jgi:lipopolysaccharide export system protein LptA
MKIVLFVISGLALLAAASTGHAQNFGAAFTGFDTGSNDPIQIEADNLEVRDPDKLAIYSGRVKVRQGNTVMEAPELKVFYTGNPTAAEPAANGKSLKNRNSAAGTIPPQSAATTGVNTAGSRVSRLEAGPKVVVRSKDQTATGDRAVFEMDKDLITMTGNVVLTQGANIVHGARLVVNTKTKLGRMEGGRVQTLITPSGAKPKSK